MKEKNVNVNTTNKKANIYYEERWLNDGLVEFLVQPKNSEKKSKNGKKE